MLQVLICPSEGKNFGCVALWELNGGWLGHELKAFAA
jgi:hypothetical protein